MEIFKLDRSRWLLPETSYCVSKMKAADGKFCCLGLYGLVNGVSEEELRQSFTPRQMFCRGEQSAKQVYERFVVVNESDLSTDNSYISNNIIAINDCSIGAEKVTANNNTVRIDSQEQRESLLVEEFAKLDIQVEFFGELSLLEKDNASN